MPSRHYPTNLPPSPPYRIDCVVPITPLPTKSRAGAKSRSLPSHLLSCRDLQFAAHIKNRSYILESLLYYDGHEGVALLDTAVQKALPCTFDKPPSYTHGSHIIATTGNQGLGMFANCDISAGGIIIVEQPLVVSPFLAGFSQPLSELYDILFDCLPIEAYEQLASLCGDHRADGDSLAAGIVRTNAFIVTLSTSDDAHPDVVTHRAVFPTISRCNHSCGPNASPEWDLMSFSLRLEAVRPIAAGEEITIPYVAPELSYKERHKALRQTRGFDCQCSYCILPDPNGVYHSDLARQTLLQVCDGLPSFEEWCIDSSYPDDTLIGAHTHAVGLIEREGLHALDLGKHIDALGMCYGALRDKGKFRYWVQKALDLRRGSNPEKAVVLSKWYDSPETFPVWGWRKTLGGSRHAGRP